MEELDHVEVGSQLTGIVIEAVDEGEQRDETMDGTAHALTLDWNPNISVPLQQGRCTVPPIPMPWKCSSDVERVWDSLKIQNCKHLSR